MKEEKVKKKYVLYLAATMGMILVSMFQPVVAVTIRNPNSVIENVGTWNASQKYAQEAHYSLGIYLTIWFEFTSVPQGMGTYQVRISYQGMDGFEPMFVYYRWGDESVYPDPRVGGWVKIDECWPNSPHDYWITIASATHTTLQVAFQDTYPETFFDPWWLKDGITTWYFGSAPQLKYY